MGREIAGLVLATTGAGLIMWTAAWLAVREQWGPLGVLAAALVLALSSVLAMRYDADRSAERRAAREMQRERRRTAELQERGPQEARTADGRTAMPKLPPR